MVEDGWEAMEDDNIRIFRFVHQVLIDLVREDKVNVLLEVYIFSHGKPDVGVNGTCSLDSIYVRGDGNLSICIVLVSQIDELLLWLEVARAGVHQFCYFYLNLLLYKNIVYCIKMHKYTNYRVGK